MFKTNFRGFATRKLDVYVVQWYVVLNGSVVIEGKMNKPTALTLEFKIEGRNSHYQSEKKANCDAGTYPETVTLQVTKKDGTITQSFFGVVRERIYWNWKGHSIPPLISSSLVMANSTVLSTLRALLHWLLAIR